MLPPFSRRTGTLPPGIHDATWKEFVERFGGNDHRRRLLNGMLRLLQNLRRAGCSSVLMNGNFVTSKELPNDYDGVWDPTGIEPAGLDPVLLDFSSKRAVMKRKYFGEVFPESSQAAPGVPFSEFFQQDRDGRAKGIVRLRLGELS